MESIKSLVKKMSVDEKIKMLTGVGSMGISGIDSLNINGVLMSDGPHGVRELDSISSKNGEKECCTLFPCLAALGATWDRQTAFLMGEAIAKDCINHNKAMILAPAINIKRIDLAGRNFEYFSEDPVLTGELAAAYINGVQSLGIGTSLKHFAVNNQEVDRLNINVEIDERTLRELYLKGFEIAVKKSNPTSVMAALNKINAVLCSENKALLTDILKKEWKYDGFVISDWGCARDTVKSLNAGLDLQMPYKPELYNEVKLAIKRNEVSMERLDDAAERILKFVVNSNPVTIDYNRESQHNTAKYISEESIVLLKNENKILPITPDKYKKIVVLGEYAADPVVSGWGSSLVNVADEWIDKPIECLQDVLSKDICIDYIPLYSNRKYPEKMPYESLSELSAVDDADLVVMFMGRPHSVETEGTDRTTSHLDSAYEFFIKRIYQRNKNIVVVTQAGGAFLPLTWQNKIKALVHMWLGGEGAGMAIAEVLTGKINPSGKLSETFPYKTRSDIDYPGDGYKVAYDEKLSVGYRYYDKHPYEVWFPFGFGMSYTNFDYSDLYIEEKSNGFSVVCSVKNSGNSDGKEVIQLYVNDKISTVVRPEKELIDFKKVFIKSGESIRVKFDVNDSQLAYYNVSLKQWVTEPGIYNIMIGSSSADIYLYGEYMCKSSCPYTMDFNADEIIG